MNNIKSLSHNELTNLVLKLKQPPFRVKQIEEWLYGKHIHAFSEMTNIPNALRKTLSASYCVETAEVLEKTQSNDGSCKYILKFPDGIITETVGMPSADYKHLSICVSSQAGCAMNCSFCATGKLGLVRNLTIGEIIDQITIVAQDFNMRPSSVVVMGQGEPFANYNTVINALYFINQQHCLGIGARHITVSTCGIINGIKRFALVSQQYTLAISLHSAIQKTRDVLMPGIRENSLVNLHKAIKHYIELNGRRPSFEYIMISGINDDEEHLHALVSFCSSLLCHVNLIPYNQTSFNNMKSSSNNTIKHFQKTLLNAGIETTIRKSRGQDIAGACGQLIANYN